MANVIIRNLDKKLVDTLKERAKAHNRSLEAELRQILANTVSGIAPDEIQTLAERIAALTPAVPQSDSTDLLRQDRDR